MKFEVVSYPSRWYVFICMYTNSINTVLHTNEPYVELYAHLQYNASCSLISRPTQPGRTTHSRPHVASCVMNSLNNLHHVVLDCPFRCIERKRREAFFSMSYCHATNGRNRRVSNISGECFPHRGFGHLVSLVNVVNFRGHFQRICS